MDKPPLKSSHTSRIPERGRRKVAQFEILQHCQNPTGPSYLAATYPAFPLCVWVLLDEPPPALPCGKQLYRLDTTRPGMDSDGNLYKVTPPDGYTAVVCACMGRLIE